MDDFPPLIREIMSRVPSCTISIRQNEDSPNGIEYALQGFYKSGEARLVPVSDPRWEADDRKFIAHCRYDETSDIHSFQDVVALNIYWFMSSCKETWKRMDPGWEGLALEMGLVERKEVVQYKYKYPHQPNSEWR